MCKSYDINWLTKKHNKNKKEIKIKEEDREEYERQEQVVRGYISEINVIVEQGKIILEIVWYIILFAIPIVLFVLCILSKVYGFSVS